MTKGMACFGIAWLVLGGRAWAYDWDCTPGSETICADMEAACADASPLCSWGECPGSPSYDGTLYVDCDCDTHAGSSAVCVSYDSSAGETALSVANTLRLEVGYLAEVYDDCDDSDASVNPAATEICDSIDNDCNGDADDDDSAIAALPETDCATPPINGTYYYYDSEPDGYGVDTSSHPARCQCSSGAMAGYTAEDGGDCDDTDSSINPGATDAWYDGIDSDCGGNDDCDQDGDGESCDSTWGASGCYGMGVCTGGDCNDGDATIHTGALEMWYDGIDQNCDSEDCDQDGDGHDCDPAVDTACASSACAGDDCNDSSSATSPSATEICNDSVDNDCDNLENDPQPPGDGLTCGTNYQLAYSDQDLDGYGPANDTSSAVCLCDESASGAPTCDGAGIWNPDAQQCYTTNSEDCDDNNARTFPGAPEQPDGHNNDCDEYIAVIELDCDDDGYIIVSEENLRNPTGGLSASNLDGLGPVWQDCSLSDAGIDVGCWTGTIYPLCDTTTGLLSLDVDNTELASRLIGGRRILPDNFPETDAIGGDCDDLCPERNPGYGEVCDGLDNDCDVDNALADSDANGLPDAIEAERVSGPVHPDEVDSDGDGVLACDGDDNITDNQTAESDLACDEVVTALGDCSNTCSLAWADADVARCDGIPEEMTGAESCQADGDPSEQDEDGDLHMTCGMSGVDLELEEHIYVLAFVYADALSSSATSAPDGGDSGDSGDSARRAARTDSPAGDTEDSAADSERPDIVPLIAPRWVYDDGWSTVACDSALESHLDDLLTAYGMEGCQHAETYEGCSNRVQRDALKVCAAAVGGDAPEGAPAGDCVILDLTLSLLADRTISSALGIGDTALPVVDRGQEDQGCSDHPEQVIARTVWPSDRIIAARELVARWECSRQHGAICRFDDDGDGALSEQPALLGHAHPSLSQDALDALGSSDSIWWKEIARFSPVAVGQGLLTDCWSRDGYNLTPSLIGREFYDNEFFSRKVGGDCADSAEAGAGRAHRDLPEGPGDLVGIYAGSPAYCDTCTDGIDNNCDGNVDCADPACNACFVGHGAGCAGGGSQTPCNDAGCGDSQEAGVLMLGLFGALGLVRRRRERA